MPTRTQSPETLAAIMSFLKYIRFLLKSNKAKAAYVIQQVEGIQQKQSNLTSMGMFNYQDDGFYFKFNEGIEYIRWSDIIRINAYNVDLMTVDEVRLDIVLSDFQFTITEETPGWDGFIEKSKEIFESIPKDWDGIITKPAFKTNHTIIYQKSS